MPLPSSSPAESPAPKKPFGVGARLRSRLQIDAVKKCQGVVGRYTVILILKTPPDGDRRVAFLISRRFDHLAVRRNRARRLFREGWRRLYPHLAPCWMLLIPRKAIKEAKLDVVLAEMERVATAAGVLVKHSPCSDKGV